MAVSALFLYGTLRYLPLLELVLGRKPNDTDLIEATLDDATVSWVKDQHFPMIALHTGSVAKGLLVRGLTPDDVARLDFYEGGFGYALVDVETSAGAAQVYLPGPEIGPAGEPFDLDDWIVQFGEVNMFAAEEAMSYIGSRSAQDVAALNPRIRARAYSRQRAAQATQSEFAGRIELDKSDIPYSDFFAVRDHALRLQTFQGPMGNTIDRAVFWAADAALVLPYDPVRDRVLLVEQARVGPLARGDANVWQLEPVAGMVDAGETPENTAIREAVEESGLVIDRLERVSEGYPSPGTSSEYYYTYVGICDIPDDAAGTAGLAEENEDIRTHVLSFETFMEYVDSNRILTMPLILLGHWLARNRDRLRAG